MEMGSLSGDGDDILDLSQGLRSVGELVLMTEAMGDQSRSVRAGVP